MTDDEIRAAIANGERMHNSLLALAKIEQSIKSYQEFKVNHPEIYHDIFYNLLEILLVDGSVSQAKAYYLAENQTSNIVIKLGYLLKIGDD